MRRLFSILCFLILTCLIGKAQDTATAYEIISAENVQNLIEIRSWKDTIRTADFSPDGSTLAIMKLTGELEFISTETLETVKLIENLETNLEGFDSIYYSADGTELLIISNDGHALLDLETGEIIASYSTEGGFPFGYTDDFRRFLQIEIGDNDVVVYDTLSNEILLQVDNVSDYQLSPDGTLLTTMQGHVPQVRVWDIDSQSIIFEIAAPSKDVIPEYFAGTGFSPDGQVWVNWIEIIETADREICSSSIQFWDIAEASIERELVGTGCLSYRSLIFENDYALGWGLSQSYSDLCSLWNLSDNSEMPCPAAGNMWATISPNGELLVVNNGTSYNLYIHGIENMGQAAHTLETEPTAFVAFSPDSRFMLSTDLELRLWAVPASEE